MRNLLRRLWDLFAIALVVMLPLVTLAIVLAYTSDVDASVSLGSVKASLYSSVLTVASILGAGMLGVLTIITSMDEKPIIKRMRAEGDLYRQLVDVIFGGMAAMLALAALAVVCMIVPEPRTAGLTTTVATPDVSRHDVSFGAVALTSFTLALCVAGFAQVLAIGALLARLLVFDGRKPLLTPTDSVETTRDHLRRLKAADDDKPPAAPAASMMPARP